MSVGRTSGYITPEMIERWWASPPTDKPGALGNIALMLSAVFGRAVKRGLGESNPPGRTDVRKPRKVGAGGTTTHDQRGGGARRRSGVR